jgi:hypothetical protein
MSLTLQEVFLKEALLSNVTTWVELGIFSGQWAGRAGKSAPASRVKLYSLMNAGLNSGRLAGVTAKALYIDLKVEKSQDAAVKLTLNR